MWQNLADQVTSMALALHEAHAENPTTVLCIVPGRTLEEE